MVTHEYRGSGSSQRPGLPAPVNPLQRQIDRGWNRSIGLGSVGDSYNNALAKTINGLYKTEVIRHRGPWKNIDEVEYATLDWVDKFNNRRILELIGNIPPAEYELMYYHQLEESSEAA